MTDDEQIEQLRTAPLVVPLTRRERCWQIAQKVCALISVLSLSVAAVGIVLLFQLATCTNTNLGTRQGPANKDTQAHIDYAMAQLAVVDANKPVRAALAAAITAQHNHDAKGQAAAAAAFVRAFVASSPAADAATRATAVYVSTLQADKADRAKHPLGKC